MRLPLHSAAAELILNEARWMAEVTAPLNIATPVPLFVGQPSEDYPFPWLVVPWIEGWVVDIVRVAERGFLVDDLADALLALHAPAPPQAPQNPYRGVPLRDRADVVRARIEAWAGPGDLLRSTYERAVAAPLWPGPPLWLHGDPHPFNLLCSETALVAMLDFGDLTAGDPASDLAAAWWCFGPQDRARFRARVDASGAYDDHVWTRAAGWAASFASAIEPGSVLFPIAEHTAEQLGLEA